MGTEGRGERGKGGEGEGARRGGEGVGGWVGGREEGREEGERKGMGWRCEVGREGEEEEVVSAWGWERRVVGKRNERGRGKEEKGSRERRRDGKKIAR